MFIQNREELTSHGDRKGRTIALDILEAGLTAADPYANMCKLVRIEGDTLYVGGNPDIDVSGYGDQVIDLTEIEKIFVIGAGKAVQRQAQALEDILGDRLSAGAINVKHGEEAYLRKIEVTKAAHPIPDQDSIDGAQKIIGIAESATERDLVFTLFSDGASSLFVMPNPGLTLEDVQNVFTLGIKYGSQDLIVEAMRFLSAVKGGRILMKCHPALTVNTIMQVGRTPRWHGTLTEDDGFAPSWPPIPAPLEEIVEILKGRPWWNEFTPRIRAAFESLDPNLRLPDRDEWATIRHSFWQPIDLHTMVAGAQAKAEDLGLQGIILSSRLLAYSDAAANVLAHIANECETMGRPWKPPVALITGGHLDVPVGDATGIGGRNQEFSVLWAQALHEGLLKSRRIVVAAMDSDGTDGPGTQRLDAAGANDGESFCMAGGCIDGYLIEEAEEAGVDVVAEMANHNSSIVLLKLKSAIYTSNTGMALGDLRVAVVR